jgi:group I intron endonuclease
LWHNKITGKIYIGQATDLGDRKKGRLNRYYRPSYLRANSKGVSLIRAALIKYGLDKFSVAILEYCSVNDLDSREQY